MLAELGNGEFLRREAEYQASAARRRITRSKEAAKIAAMTPKQRARYTAKKAALAGGLRVPTTSPSRSENTARRPERFPTRPHPSTTRHGHGIRITDHVLVKMPGKRGFELFGPWTTRLTSFYDQTRKQ